jgi:hypothetical protein
MLDSALMVVEWRSWGWKVAQVLTEKIREEEEKGGRAPYYESLLREYKEIGGL